MANKSRYILMWDCYPHVRCWVKKRQSSTSTVSDRMDFWLSQNSRLIWCITSLFHNDTHQQIGDNTEKNDEHWKPFGKRSIYKWWSMLMLIVIEHDFHLFLKPASHAHGVQPLPSVAATPAPSALAPSALRAAVAKGQGPERSIAQRCPRQKKRYSLSDHSDSFRAYSRWSMISMNDLTSFQDSELLTFANLD